MKAAAIQLAAHDRNDLTRVWSAIEARVREAASAGAELVVLPEGTLPAYVLGYEDFTEAETREQLDSCAKLAKEHSIVLVVGSAHMHEGRVYNGATVFDRNGEVSGIADKCFLWHFDRQWFAPARALEPIATAAGMLGVLICADGRIPTIARSLVDRGAQLLVMPTAWVTSGRDPRNFENIQADLLARVRARENGVPFIAANKCGVERRCVAYCGKSQIISAQGEILAIAAQDRPEIIFAEIEIAKPRPMRSTEVPETHARIRSQIALLNTVRRIAITAESGVATPERLHILEAELAVTPESISDFLCVDDSVVEDPGGLTRLRLEGCDLVVWQTQIQGEWQLLLARARALELRMYVVVIDGARTYAVDPDGSVLCGTFGDYAIASFTYDPARTAQTLVAPGTDVLEGLLAVEQTR